MKASKMDGLLDEVKAGLGQSIPAHTLKEKKVAKKVAKKKGSAKPETEAKSNGKAKAAADDNLVTLADLAKEAKIGAAAARRKIRATEMERDGRWAWPVGSKQLKTARGALGL
jgi:hypothetical protein